MVSALPVIVSGKDVKVTATDEDNIEQLAVEYQPEPVVEELPEDVEENDDKIKVSTDADVIDRLAAARKRLSGSQQLDSDDSEDSPSFF